MQRSIIALHSPSLDHGSYAQEQLLENEFIFWVLGHRNTTPARQKAARFGTTTRRPLKTIAPACSEKSMSLKKNAKGICRTAPRIMRTKNFPVNRNGAAIPPNAQNIASSARTDTTNTKMIPLQITGEIKNRPLEAPLVHWRTQS